MIDHKRERKRASKRKGMEREHHVWERKDVQHKSVKLPCASTQFIAFLFCGPHAKPHGVIGLSKHYHLRLEPKLGHGKCEIRCILCACISFTNMLDKPWVIGGEPTRKTRYQPV